MDIILEKQEIIISEIDDNKGLGLRNLTIKPLSTLRKTRFLNNYNKSIGSFVKCEEILFKSCFFVNLGFIAVTGGSFTENCVSYGNNSNI